MKIANVFDNALLYRIFQFGVIKSGTTELIKEQILKPVEVKSVLDFGCGIGYHSVHFADSQYLGIEPLEGCVVEANKKYKTANTTFLIGDHQTLKSIPDSSFELIISIGVLHHIDNEIFSDFMEQAFRILKPGGRLTTFDPVFHENQSLLSRWVVSRDRGNWVRTAEGYLLPVRNIFGNRISFKIHKKLLRIPYDHISIEVIK